ncbi:LysR family transcriptional regulator [Telmatospirillum sp.]|uniref:LysR family transcriptional regulator n=1 Tax=Telmatospirillum sp. TaxID=2079197 RepID=UPI00283C9B28|nr:LysR family transcriptional regulator [Telmatospirillum sp.]MDR3435394.1 LysR family transcriptional regulator [Telmatospirillum sp.]
MDYLAALRLFVRTVELGSFSKAADDRAVKISSVSRAVAALESDLGVALLNRSTRRLHATEAGLEFFERAQKILADVQDAREQIASLNGRPQGLLRINIPGAFGRRHVLPLLPAFLARYPDIRVDATLTDQTVDLIDAGADLAIRIGALPNSSLIGKKLAPHRRLLCASPGYLATHPAIAHPKDLADQACLRFSLLQPLDHWHFNRDAESLDVAVSGPLTANDSEALLEAALQGLGIALLPTWLTGGDMNAGRLASVLPDWQASLAPGDRSIWGVYPPKKNVSPKVRAFLDFVEERFGRPPYWDLAV